MKVVSHMISSPQVASTSLLFISLLAACSMRDATALGCEKKIAWVPLAPTTMEPARLAIARGASGGILLSSVATKYQLGFVLQAGSLIAPLKHAIPHGT